MSSRVTILGAGVAGLCVATELVARGLRPRILDPMGAPGRHGCSWWAGGMLAPFCEGESAEPEVTRLGLTAADWWQAAGAQVHRRGSLVVTLARDRRELDRFARRTGGHVRLDGAGLAGVEPGLADRFTTALHFPEEAHVDPRAALAALVAGLDRAGVVIETEAAPTHHPDAPSDADAGAARPSGASQDATPRCDYATGEAAGRVAGAPMGGAGVEIAVGRAVAEERSPDRLGSETRSRLVTGGAPLPGAKGGQADTGRERAADAGMGDPTRIALPTDPGRAGDPHAGHTAPGELTVDCRGLASCPLLPGLRGVRGEMAVLRAPGVTLDRPVRLLHPRHPLYIVPRGDGLYMLGATQIESAARGPATLRSVVELLSAAYALDPAFGEAEVLEIGADARPAFPDNLPRVLRQGDTIHVNGLFRHGFLLAPAMARRAADMILGTSTEGRPCRSC